MLLDAVRQLGLLLVLQLRQRGRLLRLMEVWIRRILALLLLLVFDSDGLLHEGGVPLLRYSHSYLLVVAVAADRGLRTLLCTLLLEMQQRRVVLQRIRQLVLATATQRMAVVRLGVLLMEVWLRLPETLLVELIAWLVIEDVLAAVGNLVVGIAILRVTLDELAVIIHLGDVPVDLINKHTGEICFYQ